MEKWRDNTDNTPKEIGESFHAEMPPVAPDVIPEEQTERGGMVPPGDPDGYVGPDGRAQPHEEPAEVAERQRLDRGLEGPDRQVVEDLYDTEE